MIKDVWGKPTSGKVTLDIYAHFGSEKQTLVHEQIPIGDKDTLATFTLKDGRRKKSLREDQVAGVIRMQNASDRHLLAQQLAGLPAAQSTSSGSGSSGGVTGFPAGFPFVPGFFLRRAVGYRPVLSTLPTGAFMTVSSSGDFRGSALCARGAIAQLHAGARLQHLQLRARHDQRADLGGRWWRLRRRRRRRRRFHGRRRHLIF